MSADEKFFAWLDGELNAGEAEEMEARVRADPELARLADQHRAMRQRVKGAFDTLMDEPVPPALAAAAREVKTDVVRLKSERSPVRRGWRGGLAPWMSLAATLAVGILIGTMVPQRADTPLRAESEAIYAAAGLANALDTQLTSAPVNSAVRIGVTFRDHSGRICRSFTQPASSGVACRSGDAWKVHGLYAAAEGQSADYRMAAGTDPQLAALIGSMIDGEPLDAAGERAAKDRGWR